MTSPSAVLLIAALALSISLFAQETGPIAAIWAVNDGEKIKRDDVDNPNKAGNSAWKDGKISLFAARNELVAFQVIVQAGPQGAKDVDVTLESLAREGGKERLKFKPGGNDPTDWRGGQIERFTQHY